MGAPPYTSPEAILTLHDFIPILVLLGGFVELLIGLILKDAKARIDALVLQAAIHETRIAVLQDSKVHERVDDHETRIRILEASLSEIRGDLKIIRNLLEKPSPPKH